jgi:hypothetical protein
MRARTTSFFPNLLAALALASSSGCADEPPDPRTVRGAIAAAAQSIETRDAGRLFRVIDQRARHAMASIVRDRRDAKALIEADYPAGEQQAALAALGDAALVEDAAALFALRCPEVCMRGLGEQLAAPQGEVPARPDVTVTTARGTTLYMHAGTDGRFGLVWHTQALSEERDRASRELLQIRDNAAVYKRRRALEAGADPSR